MITWRVESRVLHSPRQTLLTLLQKGLKMALLSRDAILKADDLKTEEVDVPEWGGTVKVRAMTGRERDSLEAKMVVTKGNKQEMNMADFRARLVALSIVDEKDHRLFSESDVKTLGNKSAAALDRVAEVASRLSGMSPEDIKELTEGFDSDPSGGSTSD